MSLFLLFSFTVIMSDEEPSTTYHSDTAETVVFTESDDELDEFEEEYSCDICKLKNPDSVKLLQVSVEGRVENIVWLQCSECRNFFHLSCISLKYTLSDLLEIIETSYICAKCT